MEKTGIEPVLAELRDKGFSEPSVIALVPFLEFTAQKDSKSILSFLKEKLQSSETGLKGINELEQILNYLADMSLADRVEPDISLARGLNYYTGTIIEVKAADVPMGSICGGGRYDDLTGIFGLEGISGVGISFGADRIYDVMNELNLFPAMMEATTKVMFVNFGEAEEKYCLPLLSELRDAGIPAEIFPESAKMKKQLDYANRKNIAYVILVGENEMKENKLTVKNMLTGEQSTMEWKEVMKQIAR